MQRKLGDICAGPHLSVIVHRKADSSYKINKTKDYNVFGRYYNALFSSKSIEMP